MAVKHPKQPLQRTIDKVRTTALINRLQSHALNKLKIPMNATQIRAAEILLNKTCPNLQAVAVDLAGAVTIEVLQVASHKATK